MKLFLQVVLAIMMIIPVCSAMDTNGQKTGVVIGNSIARGISMGRMDDISVAGEYKFNASYFPVDDSTSYSAELQYHYNSYLPGSSAQKWNWKYNMGRGGDTTGGMKKRWNRDALGDTVYLDDNMPGKTLDKKPDLIIMNIGINDILLGYSPDFTKSSIMSCVKSANARGIPVIVIGTFPLATHTNQITALNAWEKQMFYRNRSMPFAGYVDAYSMMVGSDGNMKPEYNTADNLHTSKKGFADVTKLMYSTNKNLFEYVPGTNPQAGF